MLKYAEGSYIMSGDYNTSKSYTFESESYFLSKGQNHPMQYRFKEENEDDKNKFINNYKNSKKSSTFERLKNMKLTKKS